MHFISTTLCVDAGLEENWGVCESFIVEIETNKLQVKLCVESNFFKFVPNSLFVTSKTENWITSNSWV